MNRYAITLQHASGRVTLESVSTSWQSALRAVLAIELAPVGAVLAIAELESVA
jgi:hypothetical protein